MKRAAQAEIVIVGGGMVGLCFANLLAARLPERAPGIAVIERSPPPALSPEVGVRVSALSPGSADILSRCGAWQGLPAGRCGPYRRMVVWRHGGPWSSDSIEFDAAEQGVAALGHIVENDLVCRLLWDQAEAAGVRLLTGALPTQLERGHAGVQLSLGDEQLRRGSWWGPTAQRPGYGVPWAWRAGNGPTGSRGW